MLGSLHHARRQDALGTIEGREGLRELAHVPTDARGLLHKHDLVPPIGDIQSDLDAPHTTADHHGGAVHRHLDGEQGLVVLDLLHQDPHEIGGLLGGGLALFVDPGAVLPEIGHFA